MGVQWSIIRNPMASSGKSAKLWPEIEQMLQSEGIAYSDLETSRPKHAFEMARDLVRTGSTHLLALGGDGTVNEVLNGIFSQGEHVASKVVLGQIPIGTGNDWRKSLGIPKDIRQAVQLLKNFDIRRQDLGLVEWEGENGPEQRYFCNIAGMGFEAFAGEKANAQKAAGNGGIMGYVSALLSSLGQYKSIPCELWVDGKQLQGGPIFSLTVGICKYNGGGMMPCPNAIIDDGLLDLTLIRDLSKATVVANIPRLFNGKFVKNKAVEQYRAKLVEVKTSSDNLLETDGEVIGAGNARFSLLPLALNVAVPKQKQA